MVLNGWWDEIDGTSFFTVGWLEDEKLEPLEGAWARESLPKLSELAKELNVAIWDSECDRWI